MIKYEVVLKRGSYEPLIGWQPSKAIPDIIVFYDEDKELAIKEMLKYRKKHGFATPDEKYAIRDIVLREKTFTGQFIKETSYHNIFDINGKRVDKESKVKP